MGAALGLLFGVGVLLVWDGTHKTDGRRTA